MAQPWQGTDSSTKPSQAAPKGSPGWHVPFSLRWPLCYTLPRWGCQALGQRSQYLVLWSYGPDPDLKGSPLMPATVTSCLLPQVTSAWHLQVPPPIASVSWRNLLVLTECPVQTSPRGAVMGTGEHVPPHTQHDLDAAADASPSVHCIIFGGVPQGEHSFPNPSFTYST